MDHQSTADRPWTPEHTQHPPAGGWSPTEPGASAETTRGIADTARSGIEQAAGYVQGAVVGTRDKAKQATEYIQGAVDQARGKMTEYREAGVERVKDDVLAYTREQPMTALLIAAAAGLLVGGMITSLGRR